MTTVDSLIEKYKIEDKFQLICDYPLIAEYAKDDKYYYIHISYPGCRKLFFKGSLNTTTQNTINELYKYYDSLPESWLSFAPPKVYSKKASCDGISYLITHHENCIEINPR